MNAKPSHKAKSGHRKALPLVSLVENPFLAALLLVVSSLTNVARSDEPPSGQQAAGVGTIEGTITYEADRRRPWRYRRYYVDRKTGVLAEAVVSLSLTSTPTDRASAEPRTWTIGQQDYRFIPETSAIRAGDQIRFTNSDGVLHDVTMRQGRVSSPETFMQDSFSLRKGQVVSKTFRRAGGVELPVTLSCRYHSAMRGWVYVFDGPFFQVTKKTGTFRFEGVPAGSHRLVVEHPAGNLRWTSEVEVKSGQTSRMEIRLSPDHIRSADES